jgi:hypothetical protein
VNRIDLDHARDPPVLRSPYAGTVALAGDADGADHLIRHAEKPADPVQTPCLGKDYATLAKLILANPAYAGKTVLICWNHEEIPQLAAALGVTPEPPKWKGSVFDRVYVISYPGGAAALATSRYDGR